VFLVLGNNEFKISTNQAKVLGVNRLTHANGVEIARAFPANPAMDGRLTLLERDIFDLYNDEGEEVPILGCSLWSLMKNRGDSSEFDGTYQNTIAKHTERFQTDLKWLREKVANIRKEPGG
jgi:hypothetical protein